MSLIGWVSQLYTGTLVVLIVLGEDLHLLILIVGTLYALGVAGTLLAILVAGW